VTNAFFDREMMDVLRRPAKPRAQGRAEDVARLLEWFAIIAGALSLDPDALCVYRCGLTFYGAGAGGNTQYIVANWQRLRSFLNETMQRSGALHFNISESACRGIVKWMGASPKYRGTQSGSKWEGPPGKLQQNMLAVFSRLPAELLAHHDSRQWGCWSIAKGAVQGGRDPRVAAAFVAVTRDADGWGGGALRQLRLRASGRSCSRQEIRFRRCLPPS
jgi:hypothetical protein